MPGVIRIGGNGQAERVEVPEEELRAAGALPDPNAPQGFESAELLMEQDAALLAWLEEKEQAMGPAIVKRTFEGRDWFLKHVDDEEVTLMLLLTPRDKAGNVDFQNKSVWRSLRAAILHVALARGVNDDRPAFSLEAAKHFCRSRATTGVVLDIINELSELNPGMIPNVPGAKSEAASSTDAPGSETLSTSPSTSVSCLPTDAESQPSSEKSPQDGKDTGSTSQAEPPSQN